MKILKRGIIDYDTSWQAMKDFTAARTADTDDEVWFLEHPPVFTQGQSGKAEHILNAGDIPIVQTDRGGQVTYHGPGQLMVYTLLDLRRLGIGPRGLVCALEKWIIELMASFDVDAHGSRDAPGVYVGDKKLCSIGLRIRRGCSYHGICLNVASDLSPFQRINPCGYRGLQMTQMTDYAPAETPGTIADRLIALSLTPHLQTVCTTAS